MMRLVTIKLPKNRAHDPHNKVIGPCPVSSVCTDSTGEHHTVLISSESELNDLVEKFGHITRIEDVAPTGDIASLIDELIKLGNDVDEDTMGVPVELRAAIALTKQAATIAAVKRYADERAWYSQQNRTVGSSRIASDLFAILAGPRS